MSEKGMLKMLELFLEQILEMLELFLEHIMEMLELVEELMTWLELAVV